MFDALKPKPYDFEPVYVSWPDAPRYNGDSKEDPAVWLEAIKAGCKERKVPKDYWHRVGMHYMGRRPRERLDQLGTVMQQMTNQKNVWNWKKFKIAVQNLGCMSHHSFRTFSFPIKNVIFFCSPLCIMLLVCVIHDSDVLTCIALSI